MATQAEIQAKIQQLETLIEQGIKLTLAQGKIAAADLKGIEDLQAEILQDININVPDSDRLLNVQTVNENYTVELSDYVILVNAIDGDIQITLPDVLYADGLNFIIKKIDSSDNTVTVTASSVAVNVEFQPEQTLRAQGDSINVKSDSEDWYALDITQIAEKENIITVTDDYTVTLTDSSIFCNASAGTFTVFLPPPDESVGQIFNIVKIDTTDNKITIQTYLGDLIALDIFQELKLPQESLTVQSDGIQYFAL